VYRFFSLVVEGEGLTRREGFSCFLCRFEEVLQSFVPYIGFGEVIRQYLVLLGKSVGIQLFNG
jgi:hypothetical protein